VYKYFFFCITPTRILIFLQFSTSRPLGSYLRKYWAWKCSKPNVNSCAATL